jgi:hypothetical protein
MEFCTGSKAPPLTFVPCITAMHFIYAVEQYTYTFTLVLLQIPDHNRKQTLHRATSIFLAENMG